MKKIILVPVTIVLFIAIGFAYKFWGKNESNTSNVQSGGITKVSPLAVNAMIVDTSKNDQNLSFPAVIIARETATITSEISGIIRTVNFRDGQKVSKGQLLATIDQREVNAEIEKRTKMLDFLKTKIDRQKLLFQKNGVSSESIELLENEIEQLKSEIELFEIRKSKMNIKAPFSGTVSTKLLSSGSFVNTGTPITTIFSTNDLLAEFTVSEKLSNIVKVGKSIDLLVANQFQPIVAEIESIQPSIDPFTKSVTVRARFKSNKEIYVGTTTLVQIDQKFNSVLKVPSIALVGSTSQMNVFVVKNGKAELVKVETGFRSTYDVEITSGLSIGDTVITTGLPYLKPKMPVSIKLIERVS